VKNADFLNEFFCENYFYLYLEYTFYCNFLNSVILLIYVQEKTETHNVEDSARKESKGSSEVGRAAVFGRCKDRR
jgi:hypothetical protein